MCAGSFLSFFFRGLFLVDQRRACGDTTLVECASNLQQSMTRWHGRHKVDGGFLEFRLLTHFHFAAPDDREKEAGCASTSDNRHDWLSCLGFPCCYSHTLTRR
ncbi:hypothetical protein LX32DRAFT_646664 [Colletotrichum zoysiae]|uniref:Secreted protein n=1 Tax=Colletotrichum zoysiae TaxID=1216348 RepID=A0AAD9H3L5_9PEZI|nr:hypothetical protein LX32DRAFT_646664 [Colletotrichum zoysiae]